jgi:hypothetical protein
MTPSQITSATIDELFPVAGQDNDSQGFRDNFNVIKTGLATAASEITVLSTSTAKLDEDNDFNGTVISNAQTNRLYGTVYPTTSSAPTTVNFNDGEYQVITMTGSHTIQFQGWPAPVDNVFSKIRLEIKSDAYAHTGISFVALGADVLKKDLAFPVSFDVPAGDSAVQVIEAWTADNGKTVMLTYLGTFAA